MHSGPGGAHAERIMDTATQDSADLENRTEGKKDNLIVVAPPPLICYKRQHTRCSKTADCLEIPPQCTEKFKSILRMTPSGELTQESELIFKIFFQSWQAMNIAILTNGAHLFTFQATPMIKQLRKFVRTSLRKSARNSTVITCDPYLY